MSSRHKKWEVRGRMEAIGNVTGRKLGQLVLFSVLETEFRILHFLGKSSMT
jgi:hypothetical protein